MTIKFLSLEDMRKETGHKATRRAKNREVYDQIERLAAGRALEIPCESPRDAGRLLESTRVYLKRRGIVDKFEWFRHGSTYYIGRTKA